MIVNEVNNRGFSNPTTGLLQPVSQTLAPPPFVDTNDDGFATALDALLVINFLNFGEGEGESAPGGRLAVTAPETAVAGRSGEKAPTTDSAQSTTGGGQQGRPHYPQPGEVAVPDALLELLATDVGRPARGRRRLR